LKRLLPPRPFLDAIALRVVVLWFFLRGVSSAGSAALQVPYPQSLIGRPIGAVWIVAVIILLVRVEMWRRREIVFLANLGYSFFRIAMVIVGACVLFEIGLRVAVG